MTTTLDICTACDKPFINEETKNFIYDLNLPLIARQSAEKHEGELCVYCMRDQITRDTGLLFVTVYEVQLHERIMIYGGNENEETNNQ